MKLLWPSWFFFFFFALTNCANFVLSFILLQHQVEVGGGGFFNLRNRHGLQWGGVGGGAQETTMNSLKILPKQVQCCRSVAASSKTHCHVSKSARSVEIVEFNHVETAQICSDNFQDFCGK